LSHWHLSQAARAIRQGGVIAYPTEAVFGLGCDPLNIPALERILALKGRSASKGLIIIAAHIEQLESWVYFPTNEIRQRVLQTWPGPYTWVLPCRTGVPAILRGDHDSLAVRVTAHTIAAELCRRVGPLVSTSANQSGQPAARSAAEVRSKLFNQLDYVVPGTVDRQAQATEIRDAISNRRLR
jgi:L-threonylcarbamoyladenylate synthase